MEDVSDVAASIGPASVRIFLVTSREASSRGSRVRGKKSGGVRFHSASAARAAWRRPGVCGVGGSCCLRPPGRECAFEWSFAECVIGVRGDDGPYGSAPLAALEKRSDRRVSCGWRMNGLESA